MNRFFLLFTGIILIGLSCNSIVDFSFIRVDSDELLFVSNKEGNREVYKINIFKNEPVNLTNNNRADDFAPCWAPSGKEIAFVSYRDGNAEIYKVKEDGSALTRLTFREEADISPNWDPRGKYIAFAGKNDNAFELFVVPAKGGEQPRQLTFEGGLVVSPRYSPKGNWIAYTGSGKSREVYVIDREGKELIQLTNNGVEDFFADWSPDEKWILFVTFRENNWDIYKINFDTKEEYRLTSDPSIELAPCWSPKGDKIIFQSSRSGVTQIYLMNTDGTAVTQLTSGENTKGAPIWSPKGKFFAFIEVLEKDNWELRVEELNTKKVFPLAPSPGHEETPCFRPLK